MYMWALWCTCGHSCVHIGIFCVCKKYISVCVGVLVYELVYFLTKKLGECVLAIWHISERHHLCSSDIHFFERIKNEMNF